MIKEEWITIKELQNKLNISKTTLSTYLSRAEFDKYTKNGVGRAMNSRVYFYKCYDSMKALYDILSKSRRFNPDRIKKGRKNA